MTDPGYQSDHRSTKNFDTKVEKTEFWQDYLRTRQGSVSLAFHAGHDDFNASAFAQRANRFLAVRFATDPLDYQRSQHDVRADGDHSHRLLVPLKGEFQFAQGDAKEVVSPGKIAFFHWGKPFYMRQDGPLEALIITVPENSITLPAGANAPLVLHETRALVRMLGNQARELGVDTERAGQAGWTTQSFTVACTATLHLLEGALNADRPFTTDDSPGVAVRARAYMEMYANDHSVTPDVIAKLCNTSRRTLHNALTEAEGLAPAAALLRIRLERARQRLSAPHPVDIDRIACETGFTTTRRLRESFQRHYGQTPNQMRQELFGSNLQK